MWIMFVMKYQSKLLLNIKEKKQANQEIIITMKLCT